MGISNSFAQSTDDIEAKKILESIRIPADEAKVTPASELSSNMAILFSRERGFIAQLNEQNLDFFASNKLYDKEVKIYSSSEETKTLVFSKEDLVIAVYHADMPVKYEVLSVDVNDRKDRKHGQALIRLKSKDTVHLLLIDLDKLSIIYFIEEINK